MGRTLPWKKQGAGAGPSPGTRARATKTSSSNNNDDVSTLTRESPPPSIPLTPRPRVRPSAAKSSPHPNTRPAHDNILDDGFGQESPAGAPDPLEERLMVPGLQNDDKWRMVEDEFVAMAHQLTAHLHAAEYQRLKKLAQDQNADAIQSLSRPVTAPMTGRVKRRRAAVSLQRSQAKGITRASSRIRNAEEDEVDELPWAGTNLEGLMDSPRKKMIPLTRIVATASGTRAAALSRKDSISIPKGIPRGDRVQQADSPSTTRKSSVRFSKDQKEDEDGFETHSVPWRPSTTLSSGSKAANNAPSSSSTIIQKPSSTAQGRTTKAVPDLVQKQSPASVTSNVDDESDSPVEIMFGQHFRARRNKSRVKSSTPETSRQESQRSGNPSKKGPVRSSHSNAFV